MLLLEIILISKNTLHSSIMRQNIVHKLLQYQDFKITITMPTVVVLLTVSGYLSALPARLSCHISITNVCKYKHCHYHYLATGHSTLPSLCSVPIRTKYCRPTSNYVRPELGSGYGCVFSLHVSELKCFRFYT